MERLKRYNKQIVALMSALIVLVGGIFSTSFQSRAVADGSLYMYCQQPIVDDSHGYILLEDSEGAAILLYWVDSNHSTGANVDTTDSYVSVRVNSNSVEFKTGAIGDGFFGLCFYYQNGNVRGTESVQCGTSYTTSYSYTFNWSKNFVGFTHGGEFQLVDNLGNWEHYVPIVSWGGDTLLFWRFVDIYNQLVVANSNDDTMLDILENILMSDYSIEAKLAQLIDLQEDSVSFLEKIELQLKYSNNFLAKIFNSIQEFINPSEGEKTDSEQFESETTEKSDEIGGLVEESKTDKPDVEDMSNSIDSNLDMTSANEYGAVLLNITENEYILQMLLIVVTVAIIAYVLFGKR